MITVTEIVAARVNHLKAEIRTNSSVPIEVDGEVIDLFEEYPDWPYEA